MIVQLIIVISIILINIIFITIGIKQYLDGASLFSRYVLPAILIPLLLLFLLNFFVSFEKSVIYERGVTNIKTTLLDRLLKKSFLTYDNIDSIAYDEKSGKIDYILFLDKNEKSLGFMMYQSEHYKDDFLDYLHSILRSKCSNAKWIKIEKSKLISKLSS